MRLAAPWVLIATAQRTNPARDSRPTTLLKRGQDRGRAAFPGVATAGYVPQPFQGSSASNGSIPRTADRTGTSAGERPAPPLRAGFGFALAGASRWKHEGVRNLLCLAPAGPLPHPGAPGRFGIGPARAAGGASAVALFARFPPESANPVPFVSFAPFVVHTERKKARRHPGANLCPSVVSVDRPAAPSRALGL